MILRGYTRRRYGRRKTKGNDDASYKSYKSVPMTTIEVLVKQGMALFFSS